MSRRARLAVAATSATLCMVAAGSLVWANRAGHSALAPAVSAAHGLAAVAAAVVNINGDVPGAVLSGTGMIISSAGLVLTNNHVVADTTAITAQVAGTGRIYRVTVVGVDPTQDVAVLQLEGASGLPTVPLERSGVVTAGDAVTGLGNALGKNGAPVPASGIVTALNETLTVTTENQQTFTTLNGLIQVSAPILPGDSGGPLLNAAGLVIGMDTAGSAAGSVPAGASTGAAIPINEALDVAHQIIAGVTSPYIQSGHSGVLGIKLSSTAGHGALVTGITRGDAADVAGIRPTDVITAIGDVTVDSAAQLKTATAGRRPGDHVSVTWHEPSGAEHHAVVSLSEDPPA